MALAESTPRRDTPATPAEPTVREDDAAARLAIVRAATILQDMSQDVPGGFVAQLFSRAVPEDVVAYAPEDLAALAAEAWLFIAERDPGAAKVRYREFKPKAGATAGIFELLNDDMPFLVDSVLSELNERALGVRLVIHPVLAVDRGDSGQLLKLHADPAAQGARRESFIHIHVAPIEDAARRNQIIGELKTVLEQVRLAVADWRAMAARVGDVVGDLHANPPPLPVDEVAEALQFLDWLRADNFTFLGVREYRLKDNILVPGEDALGVLRHDMRVLKRGDELLEYTPEILSFLQEPKLLIVAKANVRSLVHRRVHLDYIGVKRFDAAGRLVGEFRIVGLFTSTAYTRPARSIPYLRRKLGAVERRAGFDPAGHSGKALANVIEQYPRDELFQIDEDTLYSFAIKILELDEHPRVRVLARRDRFDRFVSVLVFVPRERFDSHVRGAIGKYLAAAFAGRVSAFYPFFPEGPLVRVHFIIGRSGEPTPDIPRAALEKAVAEIVRTWSDAFAVALTQDFEPGRAQELARRYGEAFSAGYRDAFAPMAAVEDVKVIEGLSAERPLGVHLHRPAEDGPETVRLKVWSRERPLPLSERVPVLEHMGFQVVDERTFKIEPSGGAAIWFHEMLLQRGDSQPIALDEARARLEAAFLMVMRGGAENDGFNALVLTAGLMWRDVVLVRAISRFLRQIRVPYSQDYLWATAVKHAAIVADIVALFHARFDPAKANDRPQREKEIAARIEEALGKVESLDEDRIIRHFMNAVQSGIRTNFYQLGADGQPKAQIAVKYQSGKLTDLPLPRPLYEIFVYSPRVEGVHLRFGKVARGGIRWSDRPQDFRTEILGLVKAQQVKNAVIVPVGAKGGFVPKLMPKAPSRDQFMAEGVASYKLFIGALLDVTDNIDANGKIVPPDNVLRHDSDDPYFVVAADKGTATFSDIANAISVERGFWLGDAFASGGSAGYDHKAMGITARGAWECVKRHFRELDINIHVTPFTVAGVGDMSGDVFGNGMLRENTIRLIAAFDHRDIFIDPDPDPEIGLAERTRLFALPRSSWQDYDKSLISPGGGIYSRSAKEIVLSAQAQKAIGVPEKITPQQLMQAILKMQVDLLWFGGIGTYIRASSETDEQVGDRANDAIRITAADLRCKVIGEGANLGMTQRGRVEAALREVRLNTDAIDNSAGVNTSDVEVNIKIALATPQRSGKLPEAERNTFLAAMTDEVGRLVLRNNYLQSLALSLAQRRGLEDLGFQQRLMQTLENAKLLDRAVEFLPDDMAIAERRKRNIALTRPELAVLLAYAKLTLYAELVESRVPDDPYLGRELARYFPKEMQRFPEALETHRLRREIIATQLANSMINRGGPTLVVRIADQTGADPEAIAFAFAAVRDSYDMPGINDDINSLDNKIPGALQLSLYASVENLLLDRLVWFLRNVDLKQGLADIIAHYRKGIAEVAAALDGALSKDGAAGRAALESELTRCGVSGELARRLANISALQAAPDIVLVADRARKPVGEVTQTYYAAEAYFELDRLAAAAKDIVVADYFDRLALDRALDAIGDAERRITAAMVANGATGGAAVEQWVGSRKAEVERIRAAMQEIVRSGLTLSKLTVAASLLGDLARQ
ncbi:MAG: NAD-glutamate dehydrogenase [Pseudolabrys sp.]|nr:NAD-glutamate dehydrogenase [Pseudolabrys sp.]